MYVFEFIINSECFTWSGLGTKNNLVRMRKKSGFAFKWLLLQWHVPTVENMCAADMK